MPSRSSKSGSESSSAPACGAEDAVVKDVVTSSWEGGGCSSVIFALLDRMYFQESAKCEGHDLLRNMGERRRWFRGEHIDSSKFTCVL